MTNNGQRFQRFGHGVYTCQLCRRQTREGKGETGGCGDWCAQCFEIMGLDNTVNDGGLSEPAARPYVRKAEALLVIIAQRGGDSAKVKRQCNYLWPVEKK
jgi:hypothetical protein